MIPVPSRRPAARPLLALSLCVAAALPVLPQVVGAVTEPTTRWFIPGELCVRPKDFAVVQNGTTFKAYFIRQQRSILPYPPGSGGAVWQTHRDQNTFGAAQSANDLGSWFLQGSTLLPTRSAWNKDHIWAPSIVNRNGTWHMFYTGVLDSCPSPLLGPDSCSNWLFYRNQRIGVATSTDLTNWNNQAAVSLDYPSVAWASQMPSSGMLDLRDSYVMPDPNPRGAGIDGWLMWFVARHQEAPGLTPMVIGLAPSQNGTSNFDPLTASWSSTSFIPYSAVMGSAADSIYTVESPHVFRHGTRWFLLFTGVSVHGNESIHMLTNTSASSVLNTSGWKYRGTLSSMLGYDTSLWYASEYIRTSSGEDYLGIVHQSPTNVTTPMCPGDSSLIDFWKMTWLPGDSTFALAPQVAISVTNVARIGDKVITTLSAQATLGQPPYTFAWSSLVVVISKRDTNPNLARETRLSSQTYTIPVTVTDSRGASTTATITLSGTGGGGAGAFAALPMDGPGDAAGEPQRSLRLVGPSITRGHDPVTFGIEAPEADAGRSFELSIYDLAGRRTQRVASGQLRAGLLTYHWEAGAGDGARTGVYFVRLRVGDRQMVQRLLLLQ